MRWRSSSTSTNGKGYLGFGLDSARSYHSAFYEYNPTTDSWTFLSNFPQGRRNYARTHYLDGQLISVGGTDSSNNYFNDCWAFDLQAKTWMPLDTIPAEGRRGGISFSSASAIYYTTGLADDGSRFKETWKLEFPTSIEERNWNPKIKLYPNPVNAVLNVEHPNLIADEHWYYELVNSHGRLLKKQNMQGQATQIQMKWLSKGLYLVYIRSEKGSLVKKVLIPN